MSVIIEEEFGSDATSRSLKFNARLLVEFIVADFLMTIALITFEGYVNEHFSGWLVCIAIILWVVWVFFLLSTVVWFCVVLVALYRYFNARHKLK